MANLPNMIVTDVADLQESEIQKITKELEETKNDKKMLKRENAALKLVNQQLTTQLNEKTKQLDSKEKEVEQNCVVSYKSAKKEESLLSVNRRSSTSLVDWTLWMFCNSL